MEVFSDQVLAFLAEHAQSDVRDLALKSFSFPANSKQEILQQITGLKIAAKKFPFLLEHKQYKFPVRVSLEQASSERLARFKGNYFGGEKMIDLTGGMGMDTYFLGKQFKETHYVDTNPKLVELAKWNFSILGLQKANCHNMAATDFLQRLNEKVDLIYIDPSRREAGQRSIAMENYQPDLIHLWPIIRRKTKQVLVKFSPMQDLKAIAKKLPGMKHTWVLSSRGDLKEVLVLFAEHLEESQMSVVDISEDAEQVLWQGNFKQESNKVELSMPEKYLYEPEAGILKAGVQDQVAATFQLRKLHSHSHFYTGKNFIENYPGKVFNYLGREALQKKALGQWIEESSAHVISRNFPEGAEQIKKKLKIKERGEMYLLATTLLDEKPTILITKRLQ